MAISILSCDQILDNFPRNSTNKLLLVFFPYSDILQSYSNFPAILSGFLQASTAHYN